MHARVRHGLRKPEPRASRTVHSLAAARRLFSWGLLAPRSSRPYSRWAGPYSSNRPTVMPGGAMPPVAGQVIGGIQRQLRNATLPPPLAHRDLADQREAAPFTGKGRRIREVSKWVPPQVCARLSGKPPEYLWAAGVATVQLNDRQARWSGCSRRSGGRLPRGCRTPIGSQFGSPRSPVRRYVLIWKRRSASFSDIGLHRATPQSLQDFAKE